MVVHDVEDDPEALQMRGVDERAEIIRRSVQVRRRVQVHPVVAPAEPARKLGDRHDLDRRHADVGESGEPLDGGGERASARERTDVQLVKDLIGQSHARPAMVSPGERRRIDHYRRAVWALRLKTRRGIGKSIALVETEAVFRSGLYIFNDPGEISVSFRVEYRINRRSQIVLGDELD